MKILKWALAAMTVSLVAACGGSGNAGTPPFGGPPCSGASGATCGTASNLSLQLSAPSILNDGSQTVTATATATTSSGQALSGIAVSFEVDSNANFTTTGSTTASNGKLAATVSIGADPSNRIVTVKAKSGSLTATASFAVSGAKLTATPTPTFLAPGETGSVAFRLTNANDVALAGQPISVSAGSVGTSTGTTGVNGDFNFSYTAPAALGGLDIVATAGGISKTQTVVVQTSASTVPVAVGPILSASVAANPSVVATNSPGSTTNRTEIRALFVRANNAPIQNVRVRFDLNGDPNSIGGQFSTGSSVVLYSDANGIATTAYIPAERASPTNGMTIRACYSVSDFAPGTCPNQTVATLTVVADPLSVTIGSNGVILIPTDPNLTYQRRFVILVVDASGRAKGNVDIIPSIDLLSYGKGTYTRPGASWQLTTYTRCPNEDLNRNAIREDSEDVNKSGSLEPRKSDAAVSMIGGNKTKDDGTAIVQIEYPQNLASWLEVKLLVSATGVSGTEGRATWTEVLPVPVSAISGNGSPPFEFSAYGIQTTTQSVTYSDGTTNPAATPCQNPN
ncbi:MAG: hypothetical protein K8R60_17070 [Burkholderiales bacterium]|nr:hypothetical protein [Burkholderiales bacterium]